MNTVSKNILCNKVDQSKADLIAKLDSLYKNISDKISDGIIVTFSGGIDSTFLLWATDQVRIKKGGKLIALTTKSESMPQNDLIDAKAFAKLIKVEHQIVNSKELLISEYSKNDENRCYHCKTELFKITHKFATKNNCKHIYYGYNFSDISDTRPGHKAALENNILSPLSDAKLTKEDIRFVMQLNNLPFYDKPSSPCLSSRIMHGIEVTEKRLKDIQEMENILYDGGLKIYRVRISKNDEKLFLRIEVAPTEMELVLNLKDILTLEGTKRGYRWVTLDLNGYQMGGGTK